MSPPWAQAAGAVGKPLKVVIDLDPGIHRTGVASPEAAVALLQAIQAEPGLIYAGLQCYCGMQQHIESFADRKANLEDRGAYIRSVIDALTAAGGPPPIVSGSGTGSHRIDAELGMFTEFQVGSYVFMDGQYLVCDIAGDGAEQSPYRGLTADRRPGGQRQYARHGHGDARRRLQGSVDRR
jgi:3-hydroxy-D-aspartate aldolase